MDVGGFAGFAVETFAESFGSSFDEPVEEEGDGQRDDEADRPEEPLVIWRGKKRDGEGQDAGMDEIAGIGEFADEAVDAAARGDGEMCTGLD